VQHEIVDEDEDDLDGADLSDKEGRNKE